MRIFNSQKMQHSVAPSNQSIGWTNRQWTIAVLGISLLALVLRLYFLTAAVVDHPIRGDAIQYVTAAWNLIHRHVFSIAPPDSSLIHGDSYRDPGFPAFLAIWLSLFGETGPWYLATLLAQATLGAASITLLMIASRHWIADSWLTAAGLLMAIWPHSVTICSYLLSETLFGFLCALALFLLDIAANRLRYGWFTASGLCFGIAALTNAMLLPFAALLATTLFVLRPTNRRYAIALALSGLVLPFVWQLRNAQLPSTDHNASGRALLNLVQGSWPEYHSSWRDHVFNRLPDIDHVQEKITNEYNVLHGNITQGLVMMYSRMARAPFHYLAWYASKPAHLWGWSIQVGQGDIYVNPTLNSPFIFNPVLRFFEAVCEAFNPLLTALAAWGCFSSLLNSRRVPVIAVATSLMALYVTTVYSLLQAEPRYAIPFRGMEILLGSYGLWQIYKWIKTIRSAKAHA
jgi:hypothetical protein